MSIANAAHHSMMGGGKKPPAPGGINYVECLNNTTCLCHTGNISRQIQPLTISMWANISSIQPSLSEGRIFCLTGTSGSSTAGIDLSLIYESGIYKVRGAFIQSRSFNYTEFTYEPYITNWHHLAATFNGARVLTYIDGTLKNTVSGSLSGAITNAIFGVGCILWYGNMISGGPIGKYANLAYFGRELSASEITNLASNITYLPTDADHCYDMVIANGRIADIGTLGGWDFTTISDFQNGVYVPPQ